MPFQGSPGEVHGGNTRGTGGRKLTLTNAARRGLRYKSSQTTLINTDTGELRRRYSSAVGSAQANSIEIRRRLRNRSRF